MGCCDSSKFQTQHGHLDLDFLLLEDDADLFYSNFFLPISTNGYRIVAKRQ